MSTTHSMRLSVSIQSIASQLSDALDDATGVHVPFVLVMNVDGIAQYVSDLDRKDGCELIESLLARWSAGRADIPAHYNPDLKGPPA